MSRKIHISLNVRGALMDMSPKQLAGLFLREDGTNATAKEAKMHLLDLLSKGHECIPFGDACEGFDFKGGGCPGHECE